MPRAKSTAPRRKRHKKIIKMAKGYRGQRGTNFRRANETVIRALQFAYRDRKARKRDFRKLWIIRINAAARENGLSYSALMNGLRKAEVDIDRKVLADLAANDPQGFAAVARKAQAALS